MTSPREWRSRFRAGDVRQTSALCPGFVQANIALIPSAVADAFEAFLRLNPQACPMLTRGRAGDPRLPELGDFDLRTDLPLYRVLRDGREDGQHTEIEDLWRDDLVPFAIGCSLTFEADLVKGGVSLRSHSPGVSCSAFDTTLPNCPAGVFGGTLVVSMRAIRADQVALAERITRAHPEAHGAPVHIGNPGEIGVDLERPIDGLGLTDIAAGEVAMFWACGVTAERAIASSRLSFAITHAPGHMLITDQRAGHIT